MYRKTVLITGASRGIGASSAIVFAEAGYNVVINYNKSEKEACKLSKEIMSAGGKAFPFRADVSNRKQAGNMITQLYNEFGFIDVLVNNAGISQIKLFQDITEDDWDTVMSTNLKSVYNCTSLIIPEMINHKKGKIINISSVWGMVGASCEVHYSASKAAIIGFTKALAKEVAPCGIYVNCVAPGVVETQMNDSFDDKEKIGIADEIPMGRFASPHEIANTILFLASDESNYITGQVISPNGGFVC